MRVPGNEEKYPHAALTHKIIGAAIEVQKALGPGLDEKLYENALCLELHSLGVDFERQPEFPVHYRQRFIGKLRPDLIVENQIIVEIKVAESFSAAHEAQLLSYLNITKLPIGLLLNFKVTPLGKRRLIAPTL